MRIRFVLVHDVGAGGLVQRGAGSWSTHSERGARVDLRKVPSAEPGLSPMEIWCNEAQERYVLAIAADGLDDVLRDLRARALPVRRDRRAGRHRTSDGPRSAVRQ